VAGGYDAAADRYLEWSAGSRVRLRFLNKAAGLLSPGARVLDLGCGAGIPVARALAPRARVTGVDLSGEQVARARENVPGATFLQADMADLELEPASFEAVLAFYSITHLPRSEHRQLLGKIASWLVPGGFLLASLGAVDLPDTWSRFLDVPMFFSHFDAATNRALVEEAGLRVVEAEVVEQDDEPASFLWVVARRA
jgi:SAM-dependent methyltransferase